MKRKGLLSIALVILLITSIIIPASITGFAEGESFRFDNSNGILEILSDDAMVDYSETNSTNTPWYSYKGDIKKVVFADGITKIGSYNFARLDNLTDVKIPDSVKSIGTAAFAGNNNLLSISISDNVTEIGDNAFGYNREMKVTEGFICYCSTGSYAQQYCFNNYVPFETAIPENKTASVNVTESGTMNIWTIVPEVNGAVTFNTTGGFDTIAFLFDSTDYIYSTDYNTLKSSAIAFDDDSGANLNAKISYNVEAGKRYYLVTRFSLPSKTGKYGVEFDFVCNEHSYSPISLEEWYSGDIKDKVNVECDVCGAEGTESFSDAVKNQNKKYDFNNDEKVNAKDYVILLKN